MTIEDDWVTELVNDCGYKESQLRKLLEQEKLLGKFKKSKLK